LRKLPISLTSIMLIIGMVILAAYLYFVGFWNVVSLIRRLDLWLALSTIAIDLICFGLYAYTWKILIRKGMKFRDCFEIVLVSIFADLMIPTGSVSMEVMRISLTQKRTKMSFGEVTAGVLLHRVLLIVSFGIVLALSLGALIVTVKMPLVELMIFAVVTAGCLIGGAVGMYAAFNSKRFRGLIESWAERIGRVIVFFRPHYDIGKAREKILQGVESFDESIAGLKRSRIVASTLILILWWLVTATIPYLMFVSLNYHISYIIVLTVAIFINMVGLIPIGIPGDVGVIEISMTALFVSFGVPAAIAASVTILTRLVLFWFELAISGIATSLQGIRGILTGKSKSID
jgi:uncharacterized protein (TIRG00374 family)